MKKETFAIDKNIFLYFVWNKLVRKLVKNFKKKTPYLGGMNTNQLKKILFLCKQLDFFPN